MIRRAPNGRRIGQDHQKAKLTDEQVRQMRSRYLAYVVGYEKLALEFGCGVSTARDICTFKTRYSA